MLKTLMQTLALLLIASKPAFSASLPPVLNYYPACEYIIIDSISAKTPLVLEQGSATSANQQQATSAVIQELREQANKEQASGLILTRKIIVEKNSKTSSRLERDRHVLEISADLVGGCDGQISPSERLTPLNDVGNQQIHIGSSGSSRKTIVFNLEHRTSRHEPTLLHQQVAFDKGAYGAKLGMSQSQVEEIYGPPTLHFSLAEDTVLLSYGRSHWLTFIGDQLKQVTTENHWFSHDLVNYIPFDERFDDAHWILQNDIPKGAPFSEVAAKLEGSQVAAQDHLVLTQSGQKLTIWFSGTVEENTRITNRVSGFTLSELTSEVSIPPLEASDVHLAIENYLSEHQLSDLTRQDLETFARGEIWIDKTSTMLLFDGHLVALLKGNSVNKLYFLEQVFSDNWQPDDQPWSFSRIAQGQSWEQASAVLGETAFGFEDTLELNTDNYSEELYFHDQKLIAAEITIY